MFSDIRVSEKGCVSVYGMNRFPFSMYRDEWKAIFEARNMILSFVGSHHVGLSCRCLADARLGLRRAMESGEVQRLDRLGVLWCRRSSKGAVSLYGLRRFPVTLYCDQWLRLLDRNSQEWVETFIRDHDSQLSSRGASVPRVAGPPSARPGTRRVYIDSNNIIRPVSELREAEPFVPRVPADVEQN